MPLVLLDAEERGVPELVPQPADDARGLLVAQHVDGLARDVGHPDALMVVVVEEIQGLAVLAEHPQQRLGFVSREVLAVDDSGHQPHGLVQIS